MFATFGKDTLSANRDRISAFRCQNSMFANSPHNIARHDRRPLTTSERQPARRRGIPGCGAPQSAEIEAATDKFIKIQKYA
jgi:hypothetical protein